ncbi:deoxyribonuclease-1-like [Toxotes jaculatrix]|uniref:deoxyribonuclease-1-like n=1 Tax=Toxotes jaculatrix TaxID=941984 RepID=UPI001B3AF63E|nr:deoxyribonuclease-1-like [Toxotes jaculatrix]
MRLVCALGLFLTLLQLSASLRLGAFNIKTFGNKKASNTTLMDIISTIVRRYDIILIQEVRDKHLSATKKLMEHVNKGSPQFRYIVSEPLGPSTYKERYLFLYRNHTVSVVRNYTYNNSGKKFRREPFVVMFSSNYTAVKNFVLIPQHTTPDRVKTVQEIDALYDVVADIHTRWNTSDIVLLGDFNAGCSYVSNSDWKKIRLFTDDRFHWLIPNEADTTVGPKKCPYDRIVVTTDMLKGVVHNSAEVYNYMLNLGLDQKLALAVSDHFPVEVELIEWTHAA